MSRRHSATAPMSGYLYTDISDALQLSVYTVSAWAYLFSGSLGAAIFTNSWSSNVAIPIILTLGNGTAGTSGRWSAGFHPGGTTWTMVSDSQDAEPHKWTHLISRFDGTNLSLYKNGVLVAYSSPGANTTTTGKRAYVGGNWDSSSSNYFNGFISDVAVWGEPLPDDEITSLARGNRSPSLIRPLSLVAYWPLRGRPAGLVNSEKNEGGSALTDLTAAGTVADIQSPDLPMLDFLSLVIDIQPNPFFLASSWIGYEPILWQSVVWPPFLASSWVGYGAMDLNLDLYAPFLASSWSQLGMVTLAEGSTPPFPPPPLPPTQEII